MPQHLGQDSPPFVVGFPVPHVADNPQELLRGLAGALAALLHGGAGENPVGLVCRLISDLWEGLSLLALFFVALWGFRLLVGYFAKDLSMVTKAARRQGCSLASMLDVSVRWR